MDNEAHDKSNEIGRLREEIDQMRESLTKLESESWKQAYSPANMRALFEDQITSSGVYKIGRWVVISFVVLGAIMWLGGSVYSGMQIQSLAERGKQAINDLEQRAATVTTNLEARAIVATKKVENIESSVSDLDGRLANLEKEKVKEVELKRSKAIRVIGTLKDEFQSSVADANQTVADELVRIRQSSESSITSINKRGEDAISRIDTQAGTAVTNISEQERIALSKLDVSHFPDLGELKEDIASLEQSGAKLNLKNISRLAHWSWWLLFAFVFVLVLSKPGKKLGIWAWSCVRSRRKS